jgi:hypothetical protein
MAEVVFCCSRFPHWWSAGFQSHGRIVSPFSTYKDFSFLARISGMETWQQREHRTVTPRVDASSLKEVIAKVRTSPSARSSNHIAERA